MKSRVMTSQKLESAARRSSLRSLTRSPALDIMINARAKEVMCCVCIRNKPEPGSKVDVQVRHSVNNHDCFGNSTLGHKGAAKHATATGGKVSFELLRATVIDGIHFCLLPTWLNIPRVRRPSESAAVPGPCRGIWRAPRAGDRNAQADTQA